MAKEYHIFKKKKNNIPSKKVINLYYKEDKTTRPSTIALYVLFILVVMLAVGKVAVYDKMLELEDAKAVLAKNQAHLDEQMAYLADYKEVSSQYSRYSFSYLKAEEKVVEQPVEPVQIAKPVQPVEAVQVAEPVVRTTPVQEVRPVQTGVEVSNTAGNTDTKSPN